MILMLIMNTNILFPTRLHQLREERSLYQKQVAEALSIDTPMYCRIEKGERKAKREQVIMLERQAALEDEIKRLYPISIKLKIESKKENYY